MYHSACSWPPSCMRTSDTFISQHPFEKYLYATNNQLPYFGNTELKLSFLKNSMVGSGWRGRIQIQEKTRFKESSIVTRRMHLIKAVATDEPEFLVSKANNEIFYTNMNSSHDSDSQASKSPHEHTPEINEREKLRRMRISKANKGNTPWNKGRKHSPETLQRIRERTRIAMRDPKVKMKLVNLGHAQSEETRLKIGAGVREGWERRRKKLMRQEGCFVEWQDMIAEAARKGFAGGVELQWDSYKILDEQLKQKWLENREKRKAMPRPAGNRRAPKSAEQRRKISEAIAAKWADPEYRDRVRSALAQYHSTTIGAGRRQKPKPAGRTPVKRGPVQKKPVEPKVVRVEIRNTKSTVSKRRRRAAPSYKDPMASAKLEMIKKIRAQRTTVETRKKEATERAKLLIAEAEKAAKALEMAAPKSPLAQASLLETRKLIAEAMRSIEGLENGQLPIQEICDDTSLDPIILESHDQASVDQNSGNMPDNKLIINGRYLQLSSCKDEDFNFDMSALETTLNGREQFSVSKSVENSMERAYLLPSPSMVPESVCKDLEKIDFPGSRPVVNGKVTNELITVAREEATLEFDENEVSASETTAMEVKRREVSAPATTASEIKRSEISAPAMTTSEIKKNEVSPAVTTASEIKKSDVPAPVTMASEIKKSEVIAPAMKTKMKWVCGRLIEVEED